jgi:hypothetical protein
MPRYGFSPRAARAALLATTFAVASGAWMTTSNNAPRPAARSAARPAETIVRLTSLGLERPTSDSVRVIVYSSGSARIGVDQLDLKPLADTLRLSSLPMLAIDVSQADVHVRLLSPGRMRLAGDVLGGRAIRFTATGRHIVVLKGGLGADTITDP